MATSQKPKGERTKRQSTLNRHKHKAHSAMAGNRAKLVKANKEVRIGYLGNGVCNKEVQDTECSTRCPLIRLKRRCYWKVKGSTTGKGQNVILPWLLH
jgi:hypothetical protein